MHPAGWRGPGGTLVDTRMSELAGGVFLLLTGGLVAIYAWLQYELGTFGNMGPGMFPFLCGLLLLVLGVFQLAASVAAGISSRVEIRWRELLFVGLACAAFAFLIERVGLVATAAAVVVLSALASRTLKPLEVGVLIVALVMTTVVIFKVLLGVSFPLVTWRW